MSSSSMNNNQTYTWVSYPPEIWKTQYYNENILLETILICNLPREDNFIK